MRIAIVGGGISGLAAANRLTELLPQAELVLYEAAGRLGGVLHTVRRDEFLIERSADSFTTKHASAVELCHRLGIDDALVSTNPAGRRALVVRAGRLLPVPEGFVLMAPGKLWPLLATRILSWPGKVRLLAEPLVPRRQAADAADDASTDESVECFATRRLGREAFERLVQPLVAGIYTADAGRLSMAAAMPELWQYERRHGSLWRGMKHAAADDTQSGARYGLFVAPRGGLGQLVDALAQRLPPGSVRLNTPAAGIKQLQSGRWMLALADRAPPEEFDAVILALPAHAASELLAECDPPLAAELARIDYAGCAVVSLGYRRDQVGRRLEGFGFVVPRTEERRIIAASFASEKFPGRAPGDQILIRVFVGGALQAELAELPVDELSRLAHDELAALLSVSGPPLWTDVARWPQSMPQYHIGHLARVARIEAREALLPGIALAGNAYRGVGIPQCIQSGEAAARHVAEWLQQQPQRLT